MAETTRQIEFRLEPGTTDRIARRIAGLEARPRTASLKIEIREDECLIGAAGSDHEATGAAAIVGKQALLDLQEALREGALDPLRKNPVEPTPAPTTGAVAAPEGERLLTGYVRPLGNPSDMGDGMLLDWVRWLMGDIPEEQDANLFRELKRRLITPPSKLVLDARSIEEARRREAAATSFDRMRSALKRIAVECEGFAVADVAKEALGTPGAVAAPEGEDWQPTMSHGDLVAAPAERPNENRHESVDAPGWAIIAPKGALPPALAAAVIPALADVARVQAAFGVQEVAIMAGLRNAEEDDYNSASDLLRLALELVCLRAFEAQRDNDEAEGGA